MKLMAMIVVDVDLAGVTNDGQMGEMVGVKSRSATTDYRQI